MALLLLALLVSRSVIAAAHAVSLLATAAAVESGRESILSRIICSDDRQRRWCRELLVVYGARSVSVVVFATVCFCCLSICLSVCLFVCLFLCTLVQRMAGFEMGQHQNTIANSNPNLKCSLPAWLECAQNRFLAVPDVRTLICNVRADDNTSLAIFIRLTPGCLSLTHATHRSTSCLDVAAVASYARRSLIICSLQLHKIYNCRHEDPP
jgi:hypothetical protein